MRIQFPGFLGGGEAGNQADTFYFLLVLLLGHTWPCLGDYAPGDVLAFHIQNMCLTLELSSWLPNIILMFKHG